jgi:hypothetical protein
MNKQTRVALDILNDLAERYRTHLRLGTKSAARPPARPVTIFDLPKSVIEKQEEIARHHHLEQANVAAEVLKIAMEGAIRALEDSAHLRARDTYRAIRSRAQHREAVVDPETSKRVN